jgi:hypothetical protein
MFELLKLFGHIADLRKSLRRLRELREERAKGASAVAQGRPAELGKTADEAARSEPADG